MQCKALNSFLSFLNTASVDGTVENPPLLLHSLIPFTTVASSTSPTRSAARRSQVQGKQKEMFLHTICESAEEIFATWHSTS